MRPGNLKGLLKTDATQRKIIIKTLFFQEHPHKDVYNMHRIYLDFVSATNFENRIA